MGKLDGKAAVITGASSGVGRATARALAAEGASVVLGGRQRAALDEAAADITSKGGRARAMAVDVRNEKQVAGLVDLALQEFGRLDIMVNNAGISYPGSIVDGQVEHWREMLETNILAVVVGCREAVRAMRRSGDGGHIVNVSSVAGRETGPSGQVYSATKHAVNAISEGLRQEVAADRIRVTTIMPGGILTNFGRHFPQELLEQAARALGVEDPAAAGVRSGQYLPQEAVDRLLVERPGVFLSPADVASAVVYAVTQPDSVHVNEVLLRPSIGLNLGG